MERIEFLIDATYYWQKSVKNIPGTMPGCLFGNLALEISPLGNPAIPMKMPYGPQWLQNMDMNIPNVLMSNIPGFEKMASGLMKKTMSNKGVA